MYILTPWGLIVRNYREKLHEADRQLRKEFAIPPAISPNQDAPTHFFAQKSTASKKVLKNASTIHKSV